MFYFQKSRWLITILSLSILLSACFSRNGALIRPEECPLVPGEKRVTNYIEAQGRTGIGGQVTIKGSGTPLAGAFVNIYPDTISNLLGPSQFISSPTDGLGSYSLDLPPGTYYVVARKRISGDSTGPLSPGDFYSEHQRIVTSIVEGKVTVVDLEVVPMKAPMFFKKAVVEKETKTGIRGHLLDSSGKPVAGAFAMAYTDKEMRRLPDFASTLSDENGAFTIFLPEGGEFYLAGRIHAWDMPQPGEPYGRYGADAPASVKIEKGRFVEDIQIVLSPFTGGYTKGKSKRPF